MKLIEKIVYFRPGFTLRILTGLAAVVLMAVSCVLVGIADGARGLTERDEEWAGRKIQDGARVYVEYCSGCHGLDGRGVEFKGPALATEAFLGKTREDGSVEVASERMKDLKWQSNVRAYIEAVTAAGIPSTGAFDEVHAAWSNQYGGPLRPDEIQNVALFIYNWAKAPVTGGTIIEAPKPGAAAGRPTPVPLTPAQEAGRQVYLKSGCNACHAVRGQGLQGNIGPSLNQLATVAATRIADANYKGQAKSATEYIRESIINPNGFVVAQCPLGPCPAGVMLQTYEQQLKPEELTGLVDYLSTLK